MQVLEAARQRAAGLQTLGVKQDDKVLCWLPNGPDAVLLWLGVNLLGAVFVPINTAYKGRLLQHVIHSSGAALLVADGRLLDCLPDIDTGPLRAVVVVGTQRLAQTTLVQHDQQLLLGATAALQPPPRPLQPWDTECVIFTSGTTGPSKGVLCSYRHTHRAALEFRHVGPGDTNLVALPLFHIGGILGVNFALIHGGTAAIVERFRTQTFWSTVATFGVTAAGLLGTMVQFLMQQPVQPDERRHSLQRVVIAPFGDEALAFARRFGVDVFTEYNMTELSVPLWAGPNPSARGSCGQPRRGVTLRLVDASDHEVPVGAVGELILRCDEPWTLTHGYLNDAAATAAAWRNGWFHTGDLFTRDADDHYYFVDRLKDMIRRRGENISSFELEAELLAFPGVQAAAAVAVPGDGGEDEVLAVLAPLPGQSLAPAALLDFLRPRVARFMLPRYVRVMTALPLTPTQKVEKHVLRAQGVTPDTWDRERVEPSASAPRLPPPAVPPEPVSDSSAAAPTSAARESSAPAQAAPPPAAPAALPAPQGPLRGVRVLEFAGLGPAPHCAMLLSDLGADVLCIERHGRTRGRHDVEARGRAWLQLDLKRAEGRAAALALLERADILLEGFRPGVMERLGLGPAPALQHNPRLVYGRMTGWGQTGPLAQKAGHDLNYLALTGALHAIGPAEKPAIPLNLIADMGGGALYLALGVLAALRHVQHGGGGQVVDAAMTDGVLSLMTMLWGDLADGRWHDRRASNIIDGGVPYYDVYRCADGRWLSVAALEPAFYAALWQVLGGELQWDAETIARQCAQQQDPATWPALRATFTALFARHPRDVWEARFAAVDAAVAPVLTLQEARQHPHNVARTSFVEHGGVLQPAVAPRLSLTPGGLHAPANQPPLSAEQALQRWR
ncbi:MAG: hypothetical protein RLZZ169_1470 [Pseudomonadota bacterium]